MKMIYCHRFFQIWLWLICLLQINIGIVHATNLPEESLPDEQQFHQKLVATGISKIQTLEAQNRENDAQHQSWKNQSVVYINCTELLTTEQLGWVGTSRQSSVTQADLNRINAQINSSFHTKYNTREQPNRIRFYILFVDNYPVALKRNTQIQSWADLREVERNAAEKTETSARPKIESALKEIFTRATDLKNYNEWVAHSIGTVVTVSNVQHGKKTVPLIPIAYTQSGGNTHFVEGGKARCYLSNSVNRAGKIAGNPVERLQLRATQMQQWLGQILDNQSVYTTSACTGSGGGGTGNGIVVNYSKQTFQNREIEDLLNGRKSVAERGVTYHNQVVKVFLTDGQTDPQDRAKVENYRPQGGEIKAWLHFDGSKWISKSALPGLDNLRNTYRENGFSLPSVDQILALLQSVQKLSPLDGVLIGLYEFLDASGKFIGKAQIPEYVWNCNNTSTYKPIYATVYGYLLNPLQTLVSEQLIPMATELAELDRQGPMAQGLNGLKGNFTLQNQTQFAFVCGVWNGIVDIPKGLVGVLTAIAALSNSKGLGDVREKYRQMSNYKREDPEGTVVSEGMWGCIKDGLGEAFSPPCQLAHNIAPIIVAIAIEVASLGTATPVAAETVAGRFLLQTLKVLQRMDVLVELLTGSRLVFKLVGKAGSAVMQTTVGVGIRSSCRIVFENTRLVIRVARRSGEVFGDLDWRLVRSAQVQGLDGKTYTILTSADPTENVGQISKRIKAIIKDEQGQILKDKDGNYLATLDDGTLAVVRGTDQAVGEVLSALKARFPGISDDLAEKLSRVPNLNALLNDPQVAARINALDNSKLDFSKGSGYAATDKLTERDAFLFDLQHVAGQNMQDKFGSLRKLIENGETDLPQGLIDNWRTMAANPTLRRRADYLLEPDPDKLAEKLGRTNYKADNLATISRLAPECTRCYQFYNQNGNIRDNIWADAVAMYQRLGRAATNGDWGQFFARYEAHHIFPKDLLVPIDGARNAFIKYLTYYKGTISEFNDAINGIMLKKYSSTLGLTDGVHASHEAYSRKIREFLNRKYNTHEVSIKRQFPTLSGNALEEAIANKMHKDITKLQTDLKILLENKSILGNPPVKVNDLAADTDFLNLLK